MKQQCELVEIMKMMTTMTTMKMKRPIVMRTIMRMWPQDNAVPAIPLTTAFADIDSATELPPKKKNKREYEGEKTKNSKPNNPRGGIAATISNLCNGITEGRQVNMMMDFQKQLREQQDRADARMEKMQQQQQQYMQSMMMMMMMMMGKGGYPQTGMDCPPSHSMNFGCDK